MARLLHVIALAHVLVAGVVMSSSPMEDKFDCSRFKLNMDLETFAKDCEPIYKTSKTGQYTVMSRFDMAERCTCNLLQHSLTWEAILTHEVDTFYYATRKYIDGISSEGEPVTKELVRQGDLIFFWDRFKSIQRRWDPEEDGQNVREKLFSIFASEYYNPETFTLPFKGKKTGLNLIRMVSSMCVKLLNQFEGFITYFRKLNNFTENPRYIYRLINYDENLHKISVSFQMCQFLGVAGELIN